MITKMAKSFLPDDSFTFIEEKGEKLIRNNKHIKNYTINRGHVQVSVLGFPLTEKYNK